MRIISGKFKGKRLAPPSNITARPTTDFAKEGLFNLLNNTIYFEEIHALDLFAGTGSISFELASRGCPSIIYVEQSERQLAFIRKIKEELDIKQLTLVKMDVFKFLERNEIIFDFIFADPPYELARLTDLPDIIFNKKLLSYDGLFVLEHSDKNNFQAHPNFEEHRRYGNVNFSIFKNKA